MLRCVCHSFAFPVFAHEFEKLSFAQGKFKWRVDAAQPARTNIYIYIFFSDQQNTCSKWFKEAQQHRVDGQWWSRIFHLLGMLNIRSDYTTAKARTLKHGQRTRLGLHEQ